MLVLSRKLKQEILIGENIKITVLKVKGNSVRLGIQAPREVHVLRGEIPKKSELVGAENVEPETIGDFTIVFTNSDEEKSSKVDLIPFDDQTDSNSPTQGVTEFNRKSPDQSRFESIRFQDKLPQTLQRSRLKEIVDQITSN